MIKKNNYKVVINVTVLLVAILIFFWWITFNDLDKSVNRKQISNKNISEKCCYNPIQWYLDDSQSFDIFESFDSWESDTKRSVENQDISYKEGIGLYEQKREINIALIDTSLSELEKNRYHNIIDYYVINDSINNSNSHAAQMIDILVGQKELVGLLDDIKVNVSLISAITDECRDDDILKSLEIVDNIGAEICCMAYGSCVYNDKIKEKMKQMNTVFIVSAGNDGIELSEESPIFPAMFNIDNIIVVGDLRCDGKVSKLSNYSKEYVDVFAPGTDIPVSKGDNNYIYVSGTSYATAITTGVFSIYLSNSINKNLLSLKKNFLVKCYNDDYFMDKCKYGRINRLGDYLSN